MDVSAKATPKDFKSECIGCHLPVKRSDWVHVWAYPLLDAADRRTGAIGRVDCCELRR